MASKSSDINLITFSVRVYQLLLNAYPSKFQQEYGSEMMQVFQDCCLRTVRQGGANGMVRLWAATLLDLIQSVISEHVHKEVQMKKEMKTEDIRTAGWALIMGAMAFVIGTLSLIMGGVRLWAVSAVLMVFLSMPELIVGLLAVRNRYGEKVGKFGKNILWMGAIFGPLVSLSGFFGVIAENLYLLFVIGPAVLLACLALFGIIALYKKPLSRWNVTPVIAGIWYPILTLSYIINAVRGGEWDGSPAIPAVASIVLSVIQGIALAALGYILKSDATKEPVVPA